MPKQNKDTVDPNQKKLVQGNSQTDIQTVIDQSQVDPNAPQPNEYQERPRPLTGTIEGPGTSSSYNPNLEPPKSNKNTNVILVVLSAVIAIAVLMIGVPRMAPSINAYRSDITRLELDLVDIREDYALTEDLPDFSEYTDKIDANDARSVTNQNSIKEHLNSINSLSARLATLEGEDISLPLTYALTGTFGANNLVITSAVTGDFVAKVTAVYTTPYAVTGTNLSEATEAFYSELVTPSRSYIPELIWSSGWKVASVSFYTGKFTLTEGTETVLPISYTGLKSGIGFDSTVYVEVFSASSATSDSGGGGI